MTYEISAYIWTVACMMFIVGIPVVMIKRWRMK